MNKRDVDAITAELHTATTKSLQAKIRIKCVDEHCTRTVDIRKMYCRTHARVMWCRYNYSIPWCAIATCDNTRNTTKQSSIMCDQHNAMFPRLVTQFQGFDRKSRDKLLARNNLIVPSNGELIKCHHTDCDKQVLATMLYCYEHATELYHKVCSTICCIDDCDTDIRLVKYRSPHVLMCNIHQLQYKSLAREFLSYYQTFTVDDTTLNVQNYKSNNYINQSPRATQSTVVAVASNGGNKTPILINDNVLISKHKCAVFTCSRHSIGQSKYCDRHTELLVLPIGNKTPLSINTNPSKCAHSRCPRQSIGQSKYCDRHTELLATPPVGLEDMVQCWIPCCTQLAVMVSHGVRICRLHTITLKPHDNTLAVQTLHIGVCELCNDNTNLVRTYNQHLRCKSCVSKPDTDLPTELIQIREQAQWAADVLELKDMLNDMRDMLK